MSAPKSGTKRGPLYAAIAVAVGIMIVGLVALFLLGPLRPSTSEVSSSSSLTGGTTIRITIVNGAAALTDKAYSPDHVTLVAGINNTVVFYNDDPGVSGNGVPHTATDRAVPHAFDTGIITYGRTSSPILLAPGTYSYYCAVHPTTMSGTIVVLSH